ncbi:unnamed protein product [Ascophyllum nodosum]
MSWYISDSKRNGSGAGDEVAAYEQWVNTVLRPKLEYHRERIAKIEEEIDQYTKLKEKLSGILVREDQGPLEMLVELGADCHTRAKVDDPSKVFVHVALGFHVEFTLTEAISFSDVKRASLSKTVVNLKEREYEVASDVVSAEAIILELRRLSASAIR